MTNAIIAEGLVKRFGETTALAGVDLAVRTGTVLGLLGPNGAGKTTAVRVLATLIRPDAGHATVGGYDVVREAHQVRQLIGLTGQYASVDETLTGTENLLLIGRLLGLSRRDARARAGELLDRFRPGRRRGPGGRQVLRRHAAPPRPGREPGRPAAAALPGRADHRPGPAQPQRACGTSSADLVADGVTVLLTTQYLDEADQLADEIVVIDHGRVIATGTSGRAQGADRRADADRTPGRSDRPGDGRRGRRRPWRPAPVDVSGDVITAPVTDPGALPAWSAGSTTRGVLVAELALRSPSLDEVFLTLTGHPPTPPRPTDSDRHLEGSIR